MRRVVRRPARKLVWSVLIGASWLGLGCVPEGPPAPEVKTAAPPKSASPTKTAPIKASTLPVRPAISGEFEDSFDRAELGPDYNVLGPAWKLVANKLCVRGARNKGVWLLRKLPLNARIEFDALAEAADGDIKVEAWGDGESFATGTSYTNATSYLAIFGGWKNTKHVLARLDEHGDDRMELPIEPGSDDERQRPVAAGQPYHFKIERTNGSSVRMLVNDVLYFEMWDEEPLEGPGHEHFGFNDWDTPVCFDNLKITAL